MRRRDHNVLTNAASLLICGLLAGVVVAAAAFPAVAMSGLAAKAGAEAFDKLPSELTIKQSPQISYVYASDRKTLVATMFDENRRLTALKNVAPVMQKAMIAAEDKGFYQHNGVDIKGIARAFVANKAASETTQGASTITMQLVRLSIAYSAERPADVVAATEDTNVRKAREVRYALAIEKKMTKDEILERYLNVAPFGNGAYGIFAASNVYFRKPPKNLTLPEAALLAGMVKAPSQNDPTRRGGASLATDRRNYVIEQMVQTGAVTRAEADAAQKTKLGVKVKRATNGCIFTPKNDWGFFCDVFYRWWLSQEAFGDTTYDRERRLRGGGYKIYLSLDLKAQAAAKKHVDRRMDNRQRDAVMVAAVEPGSGRIQALATNRIYKLDDTKNPKNGKSSNPSKRKRGIRGTYPFTTNPLMTGGGDIHGYQAGSTFKIFTMAAALEHGYPLGYTIKAVSPYKSKYNAKYGSSSACGGTERWCPKNASPSMNGVRNMWSGFGSSVNTYFVPLEERVGADNAVSMAKRLGIKFRSPDDALRANNKDEARNWGAFTLGVSQTTPLDLANAYATLAADGKYCEPTPVREIRDAGGAKIDVGDPRCRRAVATEVARAAIDAARCPVADRSSTSRCSWPTAPGARGTVGKPLAGKTGTTDGNRTATLVLTTKQLAVAGTLADPDWADNPYPKDSRLVNDVVSSTLRDAMKGKPSQNFTPPSGKVVYGDQRAIPTVQCQSVESARSALRNAGFEVEIDRTPVDSNCRAGTVAGTEPSGRTIKGGIVILKISNGKKKRSAVTRGGPGGPDRPRSRASAACLLDPRLCPP